MGYVTGQYRAPDEKTIRVVLDRLDPRALTRALLGPRPRRQRRPGGPFPRQGYRNSEQARRQAAGHAGSASEAWAAPRTRLPWSPPADGTRVHLLGVAEHGGHLLDHLEVNVKHNETSHFTALLGPLDLEGAVVTFDALHTGERTWTGWQVRRKATTSPW